MCVLGKGILCIVYWRRWLYGPVYRGEGWSEWSCRLSQIHRVTKTETERKPFGFYLISGSVVHRGIYMRYGEAACANSVRREPVPAGTRQPITSAEALDVCCARSRPWPSQLAQADRLPRLCRGGKHEHKYKAGHMTTLT